MKRISEIIERNARLHGDLPAVADRQSRLTHAELARRAWQIADALRREFRLGPGDHFGMLSYNRAECVELLAASGVSGITLVPLNWRLAPREIASVVADAELKLVFIERAREALWMQAAALLAGNAPPIIWIEDDRAADGAFEALARSGEPIAPPPPEPQSIAHIIYTSGTTGRPKGAMLSQNALAESARSIALMAGHRPTDRILVVMPLFHVGGIIEWYAVQYLGGGCFILPQFEPGGVFSAIERERLSVAHLAPVMVKRMVESGLYRNHDLSSLKRIHYGSAPVPPEELKRAHAVFGPVFTQLYGMTESPSVSMLLPYQQKCDGSEVDLRRLASAGQPYPDTELWICRSDGSRAATHEIGEVIVRAAAQFSGYWRNEEATRAAFMEENALRTGDLGFLDEHGYLYIVDRAKDVIISGGENIYSREVEDALLSHPAVADAAVIAIPSEKWGEAVMAHVILSPGAQVGEAELIDHCRSMIAAYKRPQAVAIVDEFPRLSHGKVDKKALRAPYWEGRNRMVS